MKALTASSHEIEDDRHFGVIIVFAELGKSSGKRLEKPLDVVDALGNHADDDAPAIIGIILPARKASLFESIDNGSDRTCRQTGLCRQLSRRLRPFQEEQIDTLMVRHVEPKPVGDRLMKHDRGRTQAPPSQSQAVEHLCSPHELS